RTGSGASTPSCTSSSPATSGRTPSAVLPRRDELAEALAPDDDGRVVAGVDRAGNRDEEVLEGADVADERHARLRRLERRRVVDEHRRQVQLVVRTRRELAEQRDRMLADRDAALAPVEPVAAR